MWINHFLNSLRLLWQNRSYRRLLLALVLSIFLHLILIGQFYFNLPDLNEQQQLIEARLVLPKVLPKILPIPVAAQSPVKASPIVKHSELPKPATVTTEAAGSAEVISTAKLIEPTQLSDAISNTMQPEFAEYADKNQAEDSDLNINQNAYQYVETDFDVYTDKEHTLSSSPAGKANMVYQVASNGERYHIKSLMQAKGLVAIFMPDLLQTSAGDVDSTGLRPQHYLYQFGHKKNKTFTADFNWESRKLSLHSVQGEQILDVAVGTQDLLSFMYQFMFVPPLQTMQLSITNGKKLGIYDYSFEGEQAIETKMGNLKTIHLLRMAAEGEKKTELWLALDYQHVPVKIRETDKEGKVYELLATSIKTEPPAKSQ